MKFSWQLVVQILASICQVLNFASGMIPAKYQAIVLCVLTVLQAVTGLISHYYNPDGTSAATAYVAKVLLLCLLISGVAMAQTPAPPEPQPTPLLSTTTEAVGLNLQGQSSAATDVIAGFNLTPKVVLRSHNIIAPGINGSGNLGGARVNFGWLLDKYVSKTNIPAHSFEPYVEGAAGVFRDSNVGGKSAFSALAGGGFDYDLTSKGNFMAGFSVDWIKVGTFGTGLKYSANLTYVFAKH